MQSILLAFIPRHMQAVNSGIDERSICSPTRRSSQSESWKTDKGPLPTSYTGNWRIFPAMIIEISRVNGDSCHFGSRLRTELGSCRSAGPKARRQAWRAGAPDVSSVVGQTQPHSIRYPSRARPASCQDLTTASILHTLLRLTSTHIFVASVRSAHHQHS